MRSALADAETQFKAALEDRDRFEQEGPPPGRAASAAWAYELERRRDLVEKARARLDRAKQKLDDLVEEARKADAYPGWIR